MDASNNITKEVLESVRSSVGRRIRLSLKLIVQVETRPEKYEEKILVMSSYRTYILATKIPTRLESSFHLLDINAIESKSSDQLWVTLENKTVKISGSKSGSSDIDNLITHLLSSLKRVYPGVPTVRLIKSIDLLPDARAVTINNEVASMCEDGGPCGGFSKMYQCMCDFHGMEAREELVWDIDTIYLTHNSKELRLADFDHLRPRDLIPIVSALEHNTWFTKFNASNLKLSTDAANELARVVEKNCVLEELCLNNCGVRYDFIQKLCTSLGNNPLSHVTSLDLSHNVIDDRGAIQLAATFNRLQKGLTYLDLSNAGITNKGLNKLAEVMNGKQNIVDNLNTLILAENPVKVEDVASVYSLLAQPGSLTHLDLSSTDLPLDMLCGAMVRGCCHTVTHLNLSNNAFTSKRGKDIQVPKSWKQLFASFYSLQSMCLAGCKLPPEAVRDMLLGISDNSNLCDLHLDISSNDLRSVGAKTLESDFPCLKNVTSLNIADNGFDMDLISVLGALEKNTRIKKLAIGQNFAGIKTRNLTEVLEAVVHLIQNEDCCIEHLSLADSKLRTDTALIINSLSSNSSINSLDISGNMMGNFGARMLAKALQINKTLNTVAADRNNITAQGFEDIAYALKLNYSLQHFPLPLADLITATKLDSSRTQTALHNIESYVQRNHSPRKFTMDADFRLHQILLVSPLQNIIGKLVMQIQTLVKKMDDTKDSRGDSDHAFKLVKEADSCRQLLPSLQQIAIKSQDGHPVHAKLDALFTDLRSSLQSHIEETAEEMLKTAKVDCNTVMEALSHEDLEKECHEKSLIEETFITDLVANVSLAIFNKISEVNLSVAAHISESLTDQLIDSLKSSYNTLSYRKRQSKVTSSFLNEISVSLDSLDSQEEHGSKKLSVRDRKKRPPSVYVHDFDVTDSSNNNAMRPDEKKAPMTTVPSIDGESVTLPDVDVKSLTHLVKSRPKRPKVHATSRPMMKPMNLVDEGEINGDASDAEVAGIGGGNFEERNSFTESDEKKEKTKSRGNVPKSSVTRGQGISQGITNFFGRKKSQGTMKIDSAPVEATTPIARTTSTISVQEKPHPKPDERTKSDDMKQCATKSDDVTKPDEAAKTDDVTVKVEEKPPKAALRPSVLPKMGFGNDIMSQLKSRQAQKTQRMSVDVEKKTSEEGVKSAEGSAKAIPDKKDKVTDGVTETKATTDAVKIPVISVKPCLKRDAPTMQRAEVAAKTEGQDEKPAVMLTKPLPPLRPKKLSPKPSLASRLPANIPPDTTDVGNKTSPAEMPVEVKRRSVKDTILQMDEENKTKLAQRSSDDATEPKADLLSPVAPVRRRATNSKGDSNDKLSPVDTSSPLSETTSESPVNNDGADAISPTVKLRSRISAAAKDSQSEATESRNSQSEVRGSRISQLEVRKSAYSQLGDVRDKRRSSSNASDGMEKATVKSDEIKYDDTKRDSDRSENVTKSPSADAKSEEVVASPLADEEEEEVIFL